MAPSGEDDQLLLEVSGRPQRSPILLAQRAHWPGQGTQPPCCLGGRKHEELGMTSSLSNLARAADTEQDELGVTGDHSSSGFKRLRARSSLRPAVGWTVQSQPKGPPQTCSPRIPVAPANVQTGVRLSWRDRPCRPTHELSTDPQRAPPMRPMETDPGQQRHPADRWTAEP